jgi:adenosylmethionine-8-amino-7-oxononanoate aminotransferase
MINQDPLPREFFKGVLPVKTSAKSHTYSGNPIACSAANEVLAIMREESILEKANYNSAYFTQLINEKIAGHSKVGEIRSIGLINAIELMEDTNKGKHFDPQKRIGYQIYKKALSRGLLLRPLGDVIYFNPPLTMTRQEMDIVTDLCKECICDVLGQK